MKLMESWVSILGLDIFGLFCPSFQFKIPNTFLENKRDLGIILKQ